MTESPTTPQSTGSTATRGLGVVVLNEPFTPRTVLASVVIVVAVALIVRARARGAQPARQPAAHPAATDAEARAA